MLVQACNEAVVGLARFPPIYQLSNSTETSFLLDGVRMGDRGGVEGSLKSAIWGKLRL